MSKKDLIEVLNKYNYWNKDFNDLGLLRSVYLNYLTGSLDNNLIKVLAGQRRVGKSTLLKQLYQELSKRTKPTNILYVNFELQDFEYINAARELINLVNVYLKNIKKNTKEKCYLLFDEIQDVPSWEKAINSLLADHTFKKEIFITGSNSKLLSSELSTYITGRHIVKNIYPFSYLEYLALLKLNNNRETFKQFLDNSQLPEIYRIKDENIKRDYLQNLKDSILYKDIAQRYKIQNLVLMDNLFLFLLDNIGNLFSLNSIGKKLSSTGLSINIGTLSAYMKYFEESFIISGIPRYDIKGKEILQGEKKYYANDFGFKKYLLSNYDTGSGKFLENYVFNALKYYDYKIYVGKFNGYEIDFIAEKHNKKLYVQVTYLLENEKVKQREYKNLEAINDNWTKILVSMDDWCLGTINGIEHIQAWNFENWLNHNLT